MKTTGEGPPVILTHGGYLDMDMDMWNPQMDLLSSDHQVIRFSDLGHGNTTRSEDSLLGFEMINAITKECANDKVDLIGYFQATAADA